MAELMPTKRGQVASRPPSSPLSLEWPTVTVVVPHYDDLAALDLCLARLERQTYPEGQFEVIVADNGSPLARSEIENAIAGRARLITVLERGAGPARNGGAAVASGEVLAFTDSDCQPDPDWLIEGVAALGRFDFAGGRVRVSVANPERPSATEAFERVFAFNFKHYIERKRFTGSGNLFCLKSTFEAVGPFRAGVSEDVEWSHRALSKGFRLGYAAKAVVWHPARRTWSELARKWKRVNREAFALNRCRKSGTALWIFKMVALPLSAVAHAPRVLTSPELSTSRDRLLAISVLFRLRFWRSWDAFQAMKEATSRS